MSNNDDNNDYLNRKKRQSIDILSDDDLENLEKNIRCIIFKNLYADILARNIKTKLKLDSYLDSLVKMFKQIENNIKKDYKKYFENDTIKNLTEDEQNYIGEVIIINRIYNEILLKIRNNMKKKDFDPIEYILEESTKSQDNNLKMVYRKHKFKRSKKNVETEEDNDEDLMLIKG